MVGCRLLGLVDRRLRQATGKEDILFGGVSILLVGDTQQLPPVMDKPLWSKLNETCSQILHQGAAAFKQFINVIILKQMVRQDGKEQERFRTLLNNLRVGKSKIEDFNLLCSRVDGIANNILYT